MPSGERLPPAHVGNARARACDGLVRRLLARSAMAGDPDAIRAAAELLPVWVRFGSLGFAMLVAAAAAGVGGGATGSIVLRRARRASGAPWPERARALWSARQAMLVNAITVAVVAWVLAVSCAGPFSRVGTIGLGAAAAASALVSGLVWCRFVTRRLRPEPPPLRSALRNGSAVVLIGVAPYLIVIVATLFAPAQLDAHAVAFAAATAGVVLLFHCGVGVWLARLLGLLRPASERAASAVARAAALVGVWPRAVYDLDWPSANALALPLQNAVAFTDRALACLRDDELTAVAAHELGHLAERGGVRLLRVLRALLLVPLVLLPPLTGAYGVIAVPGMLVAVLVLARGYARLSRRWEACADEFGCSAASGATFARALETIHRVELLPVVFGRGASHPDLYDRLVAAGITPVYPRPAAPDTRAPLATLLSGLLLAMIVVVAAPIGLHRVADRDWYDPTHLQLLLLLDERLSEAAIAQLGRLRAEAGDRAGAATFYRAAAELAQPVWVTSVYAATAFALDGSCAAAATRLSAAREMFAERYGEGASDPLLRRAEKAIQVCAAAGVAPAVARR